MTGLPSASNTRWPCSTFCSSPRSTSSNSTTTQMGALFRESFDRGSPPSGHTYPLTRPMAPFIRPASTHKLCVSSTRAPRHNRSVPSNRRKLSSGSISARRSLSFFGLSWYPWISRIGSPVRRDRASNSCAFIKSAPAASSHSPPPLFCFLVSINIGASWNSLSSSALSAERFRFDSQAWSPGTHVRSPIRSVTRRNSSNSCTYA